MINRVVRAAARNDDKREETIRFSELGDLGSLHILSPEIPVRWNETPPISLLYDPTVKSYLFVMKAKLTSKGQITIPLKIRQRLGLKPGQQLDFDENAPFLKAVKAVDENAWKKARGIGKNRLPAGDSKDWLEQTRGSVELPSPRPKK